ncbi:MAG: amidohydrolase family protein [Bacteroidota bacterium]
MRILTADAIFPVSGPPVFNGYLVISDEGEVVELRPKLETDAGNIESFKGILVPGFINTHCHLDLSHLRGEIAPGWGLDAFIRDIKNQNPINFSEEAKTEASRLAENEMIENGIVGVGDIASYEHSLAVKEQGRLSWYSFCEAFGSDPADANLRFEKALELFKKIKALPGQAGVSLAPHATYSVSPELFNLIKDWAEENGGPISIHHQENNDENQYFQKKGGPIVSRMFDFHVNIRSVHPRRMRPLPAILPNLPTNNPIILVHNTVSTPEDIHFAMDNLKDPWWCLCPNANLYIENCIPNLPFFRPFGDKITLGTDSLASNHQLSILSEMKTLQQFYPDVETSELIQWATQNGAKLLGMDSWAGSFDVGKKPGVNLIKGIVPDSLKLLPESKIQVIA